MMSDDCTNVWQQFQQSRLLWLGNSHMDAVPNSHLIVICDPLSCFPIHFACWNLAMKVVNHDHVTVGHYDVVIASWSPSTQIAITRPRDIVMATTTRIYCK